jgi:hypothetical protein
MNPARARNASENLKLLDQLRPSFEKLRTERIRADSEIERLEAELEAARALAREELGTDDEDEIRRMVEAMEAENSALVDAFAATLRGIEARLKEAGAGP